MMANLELPGAPEVSSDLQLLVLSFLFFSGVDNLEVHKDFMVNSEYSSVVSHRLNILIPTHQHLFLKICMH